MLDFDRLEAIVQKLMGNENKRQDAATITELFNVHNSIFPNNLEFSKSCGGCRQRVWNRVKNYYLKVKAERNSI